MISYFFDFVNNLIVRITLVSSNYAFEELIDSLSL